MKHSAAVIWKPFIIKTDYELLQVSPCLPVRSPFLRCVEDSAFLLRCLSLTDVVDGGRRGASRPGWEVLCLRDVPGLGVVPLHQGGDQRGAMGYRVLDRRTQEVTVHVDAAE